MYRSLLLSLATFVGTLLLGCGEQQSPIAPTEYLAPSPSSAQLASGSGGAVVFRDEVPNGFIFTDEARGLTAVLGNTVAELPGVCAGTIGPETISILEILRPTGAVKIVWADHERPVVVWPIVSGDLCGVLAVTPPLAEGTASLRFVDNDLFVTGPGANSSSIHSVGKVTNLQTGELLNYRLFARLLLLPGQPFEDARTTIDIRLF
jgi:hypothetical protein